VTPERTRVWLLVLAGTSAASYGLIRWFAPPDAAVAPLPAASQENEIRNVEMRIYDDAGKPNLVLVSPRITSPRRSEEYLVAAPVFDVVGADGRRWVGQ